MSLVASLGAWARDTVGSAGYPGLAGLILLETVVPPIPSEVILPLAGFYVSTGQFSFLPAVVAATAGSLLGALMLYEIARRGGRPLLLRYGSFLRVRDSDLDRADVWFERYGGWLVLGGRMVPGIRSLVSIPAGLTSMPIGRFALLTIIGSAIWNAALIGAGWGLGSNYEKVGTVIGPASTAIVAVAVVAAIGLAVWWLRRRLIFE